MPRKIGTESGAGSKENTGRKISTALFRSTLFHTDLGAETKEKSIERSRNANCIGVGLNCHLFHLLHRRSRQGFLNHLNTNTANGTVTVLVPTPDALAFFSVGAQPSV